MVSAAAQDLRDYKPHYAGPYDDALTRQKVRSILWAAASHGHDAVVLGAFGCGAFHNPPAEIVAVFRSLLAPGAPRDRSRR